MTIDTLHFGRVSVFKRRSTSASARRVVRRPSSVVRRPSSVVRRPSSVVRRPSSVVRRPSSVVDYYSEYLRGCGNRRV